MINELVTTGNPENQISVHATAALPAVVLAASPQASKRYFEYFTVTIRNDHTRSGYFRACRVFFEWCEQRGLALETIEPIHVAAYIESRAKSDDPQRRLSKTSIKQHASTLRKMFSYFVEKGVLVYNPAREVATEKVRRTVGKTPAFEDEQIAKGLWGVLEQKTTVREAAVALYAVYPKPGLRRVAKGLPFATRSGAPLPV